MSKLNFEIKLKRETKVYYEKELLAGKVHFECPTEVKHDGITLTLEGVVSLQLSSKNVAFFDSIYNSVKPIPLINSTLELSAPGKLAAGHSEFHFEFPLVPNKEPKVLYETYHGIFIYINYQLRCEIKRSFLSKSAQKCQQFCIQNRPRTLSVESMKASQVTFRISHEKLLKNAKERITMPRFLIIGVFDQTDCCLTTPITGHLIVHHSETALKSIDLQLLRLETCGCTEGFSKDVTEIQVIQIVDGNVPHNIEIPIFMVLPRLFTCPTLLTKNFKIEFELNLILTFKGDVIVSENFPLILKRVAPIGTFKFTSSAVLRECI